MPGPAKPWRRLASFSASVAWALTQSMGTPWKVSSMRMRMAGSPSSPTVASMKRLASSRAGEQKRRLSTTGMASSPWREFSMATKSSNSGVPARPTPKERMRATAAP